MDIKERAFIALNPSKAFKVFLFHKDKRITTHMVIPKDGRFTIGQNTYVVNPERVFFQKQVPCSVYATAIAEPAYPLNMEAKSDLSSRDFYNAVESKVVQDIINASGGQGLDNVMLIFGVILIAALGISVYYLSGQISAQDELIRLILQKIAEMPVSPGGGSIPGVI